MPCILGKRCAGVRPDGDVAVARFADGSEIEADVIVGADGIHSPVRACLFGPDAPRFTGKICYRSVVPAGAVRGARPSTDAAQWLGPHGTIVLYPPAESQPGGARRPRARAEQPPDIRLGRLATAREPARPGRTRRGLARRL